MLMHLNRERRATVGSVVDNETAGQIGALVVYGGFGYGVYTAVTGSVVTGVLMALGAPVAGLLVFTALGGRWAPS